MKRSLETKKSDNERLRQQVGGDDPFFQGSDIRTPRDGGREPEPWMLDRAAMKTFLLKHFPRANEHCESCARAYEPCKTCAQADEPCESCILDGRKKCSGAEGFQCEHHDYMCSCRSCRQFSCAGMWTFAIQCCFRMGQSAEAAAVYWNEEHVPPVNASYFRRVIQQIDLARKGLRLDGKPRSKRKPGRPRKSKLTPVTSTT